jgi:hypothetical protein
MSTLHYRPGAADMCDDKRALPILAQLAGAAAAGAEPLRRPRVGRLDIAAKKLRALEVIAAAAWQRTWIMNEQPPIDPFGGQAEIMCYRHPQPYRCRIAKA